MSGLLRIAMVGCGHIGTVHSFALRQLRDARLIDAAVTVTYDADPERAATLAAHHGARVASSVDDALAHVDAVWICTWTSEHLALVRAAADHGVAVFCEKPLAPSFAACVELADVLRPLPHQVGLVLRHAPVFEAAAQLVRSERFGRLLSLTLRSDQYFPIQGAYASSWRADVQRAGGGALVEHSIHDLDVMEWVAGPVETVTARTASFFGHAGIEDVAVVGLRHRSGALATLTSVWHQVTSRPSTRRLELFFEEAFAWADDDYLGPLHVQRRDGDEALAGAPPDWIDSLTVPEVLAKPLAQYAAPTKEFLDALGARGGAARGFPDVDVALRAHALVEAAYRSAGRDGAPAAPIAGASR